MRRAGPRLHLTKARRPASSYAAQRQLDAALARLEPRIAAAFAKAARDINASPALLRQLASAIERGNSPAAIALVGQDRLASALRGQGAPPGTRTLQDELLTGLTMGATSGQLQLGASRARLSASLDLTNPRAVTYLQQHLPTLIREVTQEQQKAVQAALLRGFNDGRPAVQIAREVRDTVGLTEAQGRAVVNFRRQLETGDQGLGVHPVDRRLSATERQQAGRMFRQAAEGNPARQAEIDKLVGRYQESLINRRARNIARTEATRAFGEGQQAIWDQATTDGLLDPAKTKRFWLVTPDDRLRDTHAAVPGMNPDGVGLDEPFDTPIGPVMGPRQSGDPAFDINCRCTVYLEINE